jgi:hypothetical protein
MGSSFVSQLVNFLVSPLGLMGMAVGLMVLFQARKSQRMAWFLVSLCCFAASLAEFRDQFIVEAPTLVFPLEQLRDLGRPLTIMLLFLLLVLAFWTKPGWRQLPTPKPLKYLILVQMVIFIKTLTYGSIPFAVMAIVVFAAIILMIRLGPCRWLQDDENFDLAVWAIALVSIIFIVVNLYQAWFDVYSITFIHGWFLGTTGNPQHAATLLATTIPCFMFLIERGRTWNGVKFFWLVGLVLTMIALFLTGSRTGFVMGIVSILLFYRQQGGALLRFWLVIGTLLAVVQPFFSQDTTVLGFTTDAALDKYLSGSNSRADVWLALWRAFNDHLIFGAPFEGDRLGFGESSWLAAGATLGLLGLIPLLLFGWSCLRMMYQLNQLSHRQPSYRLHSNLVIAGLLALLIGSIFEAFLLGNLTFPLLALLTYLALGQYLLEVAQVIAHAPAQPNLPDYVMWYTNEEI